MKLDDFKRVRTANLRPAFEGGYAEWHQGTTREPDPQVRSQKTRGPFDKRAFCIPRGDLTNGFARGKRLDALPYPPWDSPFCFHCWGFLGIKGDPWPDGSVTYTVSCGCGPGAMKRSQSVRVAAADIPRIVGYGFAFEGPGQ